MPQFLTLFLLLLATTLTAQPLRLTPDFPTVSQDGRPLDLAWFGGLNAPQTNVADLDGDGTPDLLIFDRAGNQFHAARGRGGDDYRTAPELTEFFPAVTDWALARDYNQDGVPDLFVYSGFPEGIAVHRGRRRADGRLAFDLIDFGDATPQLHVPFAGDRIAIFVADIDYPAVHDVDNDGDLDILTFSVAGGYLEYYQNVGVERGLGADTLVYELADPCWGGFFESGLSTELDLSPTSGECFRNFGGTTPPVSRHSGSTVLALDYNGNGLTDIMLGDVSFRNIALGLNGGTTEEAWITEQDPTWPTGGTPAVLPIFPAAYHVDVDQDGDRDIIVSPSETLNAENVEVTWLYRNEGTDAAPDFRFAQDDWLVDGMLDVGFASNVTTFDYDGDGDEDIILGNNDEYLPGNVLDSRLRVLRNTTVAGGDIQFELVEEDYLGLSAFATTSWAYAPAFGDMDGDGDADVVIGERGGKLVYGENVAQPGSPPQFDFLQFEWQGVDAGQFSKPIITDLDRDGLPDLVVGGFDGRVRFYRNVGTATAPRFEADVNAPGNLIQLGGINVNVPGVSTGHPAPKVLQTADSTYIVAGNRAGNLQLYRFAAGDDLAGPFERVTSAVAGLDVGTFATPAFADFDRDGELEFVVGNERGGLQFYRSNWNVDGTVPVRRPAPPTFSFTAFPNPTSGTVTLGGWPPNAVNRLDLYDATGRLLETRTQDPARPRVQWEMAGRSKGLYLVRASGPAGVSTIRLIVH